MGGLFFFSGFSKLIRPIEYFEYTIGQYQIFPELIVNAAAHTTPWIEIIFGTYLLLGLWTFFSGLVLFGLTVLFQIILSQALLRKIPMDDCGCFGGNFIHLNLYQSLILDTILALILITIASSTRHLWTLDSYFNSSEKRNRMG